MNVFAWAADDGGSYWYRLAEPARVLRMLGHEVRTSQVVLRSWVLEADVIVGQRVAKPGPSKRWREWAAEGRRLVYDVDDDLSVVDRESREAHGFYSRPEVQREIEENMRAAWRVTAASERIAEWASKFNPDVRVVPNGLPAAVLNWPRPRPPADGRVVVGWVGSQQSLPELRLAAPALRRALDTLRVELHTIGLPRAALKSFGLDRPTVRVTEWTRPGLDYLSKVDFDLWVAPYRDIPFNRCLDEATLISTDRGVIPIAQIEAGMKVWSHGWREVQKVWTDMPVVGVELVTARGLRLALTDEHRLLGADGFWHKAADLVVGQKLQLMPEECASDLEYGVAPWPAEGRQSPDGRLHPLAFLQAANGPKVTINESWGRFLGLFLGDGGFNTKTALSIACDGRDSDVVDLLIEDLSSFGLHATVRQQRTWSGELVNCKSVHVASAHFTRFLASLGVAEPHSTRPGSWQRTYRVPLVILRSPLSVRAAFLAGLFEADGTVSGPAVSMTTKSQAMAEDVQRLLWSIGIPSTISAGRGAGSYADRSYWTVRMIRRESEIFAATVGFLSRRKQTKLRDAMQRRPSNAARPISWVDSVVSIRPRFVLPVDLQVEGERFSAVGIVSHNSKYPTKCLESSMLGIPLVASDIAPYRAAVEHGATGFLVRFDHEWGRYLKRLVDDPGLRAAMSERARERGSGWTAEGFGRRWEEALAP